MVKKTSRCQSCGMPLEKGGYGTDANGKKAPDYCKFCFQKGAFVEPGITLTDMIKKCMRHMTHVEKLSEDQADVIANGTIPGLKRWR